MHYCNFCSKITPYPGKGATFKTTNQNKTMTNENTLTTVFGLAMLDAKRKTLEARIERYTAYIANDEELCAKSEKHAKRYASRLRNHKDKLARYESNLAAILETMNLATK